MHYFDNKPYPFLLLTAQLIVPVLVQLVLLNAEIKMVQSEGNRPMGIVADRTPARISGMMSRKRY